MKKINELEENLDDFYKKIISNGVILLEQINNIDGTSRFINFEDAIDEADDENEVLSDIGYVFHLYEKQLYYATLNFEVSFDTREPQNINLLENEDELFKYLLGYFQQCQEVETIGELLEFYPWLDNFSLNKENDYYDYWEDWNDKNLF